MSIANHPFSEKVLPAEDFYAVIENERGRSDRNFGDFSLIVFQFTDRTAAGNNSGRIIKAVEKRKRNIDRIGWIDTRRMGLVLPHTPGSGAAKMAKDLSEVFSQKGLKLAVLTYSYPSDWLPELIDDPPDSDTEPPAPPAKNSGADNATAQSARKSANSLSNLLFSIFSTHVPWWKRIFDVLGAIALMIVCLPPMALIALFIKVVSPGPVFYKQERIGYLGRPFTLWKFRTMKTDAQCDNHRSYVCHLIHSEECMTKLDDDCDLRIIPMGKWLRSFGLDELPQLINVIRGDMSLIGPRPALAYEIQKYDPWHKKRLEALPGLTGLWQVNGKNETSFKEMVRFDLAYARCLSFGLDIKILFMTIPAIFMQGIRSFLKGE